MDGSQFGHYPYINRRRRAMQSQPAEKTSVTSYWKGHQGMSAIIGSLVVLSVFMLLLGATTAQAQMGEDPRCAMFTGQAHGLCTSALANGCFDGVESNACENLATNWMNRCAQCSGTPPWRCPCEGASAGGLTWDQTWESSICTDIGGGNRILTGFGTDLVPPDLFSNDSTMRCGIQAADFSIMFQVEGLTAAQLAACTNSIRQIAEDDNIDCSF